MAILFATSELYPFIKTGGLGDVSYALPKALHQAGEDVALVIPFYSAVNNQGLEFSHRARLTLERWDIEVLTCKLPNTDIDIFWIKCPELFAREGGAYGDAMGDYPDTHQRFYVFSLAVLALLRDSSISGRDFDVVHCNDWQTGLVPLLVKTAQSNGDHLNISTVFTIHNLAYAGIFSKESLADLNLPGDVFHHEKIEFYGSISYLKAGLVYADTITTVSPSYAEEIQQPALGYGFDGLLRHRSRDLVGILNGIDTQVWNPKSDKLISAQFDASNLARKHLNKQAIQVRTGLPASEAPLVSLVGRLVEQKGIEFVLDAIPVLIEMDCQIIVLGQGQHEYESTLLALAGHYPKQLAVKIGYDESLAHQIEAGSDIFLMPSIFEPCGLNQLYSLAYGTLPVVTPVGGLKDTVVGFDGQNADVATGFVTAAVSSVELIETLSLAISCYQTPQVWRQLQRNAMAAQFTWSASAAQYREIYNELRARDTHNLCSLP